MCHETCTENGTIIEAAAGWAGKCHIVRSSGSILRSSISDGVTIEDVAQRWDKVTDMSTAEHLSSIQEATMGLVTALEKLRNLESAQEEDKMGPYVFNSKDVILYALGGMYAAQKWHT